MFYKLDGKRPVKVSSMLDVAYLFEQGNTDRIIGSTILDKKDEKIIVSTAFLCIDHSFGGEGPPILFETCIIDSDRTGPIKRYSSWDVAKKGHEETVRQLISEGCVFVEHLKRTSSLEEEFEEISRFELMDI